MQNTSLLVPFLSPQLPCTALLQAVSSKYHHNCYPHLCAFVACIPPRRATSAVYEEQIDWHMCSEDSSGRSMNRLRESLRCGLAACSSRCHLNLAAKVPGSDVLVTGILCSAANSWHLRKSSVQHRQIRHRANLAAIPELAPTLASGRGAGASCAGPWPGQRQR